jgi:hypothetical protein
MPAGPPRLLHLKSRRPASLKNSKAQDLHSTHPQSPKSPGVLECRNSVPYRAYRDANYSEFRVNRPRLLRCSPLAEDYLEVSIFLYVVMLINGYSKGIRDKGVRNGQWAKRDVSMPAGHRCWLEGRLLPGST